MGATNRAVLQLLLTRGLGARSLGRLLDAAAQQQEAVEDVVRLPSAELVQRYELKADVAGGVAAAAAAAEQFADKLEASGHITMLVKHRAGYPERLTAAGPPVLFAAGNLSLLQRDTVGFCGARNSSELGLTIAKNLATELARRAVNVVSGYAVGVDLTAHGAALAAGGATTFVLAEGILHSRDKSELKDLTTDENWLCLSEFRPDDKWAVHNAMQRNRTICALSKAVVLIESGLGGGTFNAGEAAQSLGIPLFAIDYENPPESAVGNKHFLTCGATPLRPDAAGGVDPGLVLEAIEKAAAKAVAEESSGFLFGGMTPAPKRRRARRSAS